MASSPGKTQVEATAKSVPASVAGPQLALSEKQAGPLRPAPLQRAAATGAPPDDASAMLMDPGVGAAGRARMMRAMQGSVGNARISRMLATSAPRIQRACACGGEAGFDGECAECQAKRMAVQRQATEPATPDSLPPSVTGAIQSGGGQPLDRTTRAAMEPAFGADFGGVRLHTGAQADRAARDINAKAFTTGQNIYFAAGQHQPGTQDGDKLLAHELTHTMQQDNEQAAVQPRGAISQPDEPAEIEAEAVARQVAAGEPVKSKDVFRDLQTTGEMGENPNKKVLPRSQENVIARKTRALRGGTGSVSDSGYSTSSTSLEPNAERKGDSDWAQRTAGTAAAGLLVNGHENTGPGIVQRTPILRAPEDELADTLPPPRIATWSSDKFEIAFARTGGTLNPRLEMTVRYLGTHPVLGDGTARAVVSIGPKPLNVQVLSIDAAGMSVDLYGDASKIVRLRDDARMSELPGGPGRSHSFNAWLDQRNLSSSGLTVFDPTASPADLTTAAPAENPGANPVVEGLRFGADGWQVLLDGDGDQDKELQVTLNVTAGTGGRMLTVTAVQRSSKQVRGASLPLPAGGSADWLLPHVREVTDGRVPTKVQLFAAPDPALLVGPGQHSADTSTYRLTVDGSTADLAFPAEKAPRRKIAAAGPAQIAGGILATDITLGAYRDPFRLSVRHFEDGRATFGLSALNGGKPRDTVGAELMLRGPIVYTPLDTGPTSLGIDLNNDGQPDLQIFDRLTTPADYDGGGPPAQSRNHQIRVLGPAIGTERTYQYQYRFGAMNGVNNLSGEANTEAGRNAEAVASLAEQGKTTTLDDSLDQIEIAMLSMRRRAVDRGLLTPEAFAKNLALWQVLVRLRSQIPTGVPPALQAEAVKAAQEFSAAVQKDLNQPSSSQLLVLSMVPETLRTRNWAAALFMYGAAMARLDTVLRERMEKAGGERDKDLAEARQLGELRSELKEIPSSSKAIRVAGTYHPDEKFRTEQGYVSMVPLHLYVWKEDDEWKLKDVTNPAKPFTYSYDAKPGETLPPLALFGELDDPDHFPSGAINIQVPGGVAGRISVRDRMTWKKFFTYLGVSLAVIGLTLATIASAGATSAAVPAAWALGASALAGATAAGIDLAEHIQHDNLDARTAVIDIAQIVAGVATAGGLAAGRIVIAAGSAPAAARWSGAWAQVAMLSQRAYVPLVVGAGVADVVTVAVMAEGTLRHLQDIEESTASPGEKSRAKTLLLLQAATMLGLTALQFKGMGPLGRGETLVLSPGPDGLPIVSPALRAETVIVDANIAIALRKRARIAELKPGETLGLRESLQPGEVELLKRYDAMNPADTRIADPSITEAAGATGGAPQRGFAVGVDRASAQYKELLAELERANVGSGKGSVDRQIVGDAFFGVGESGVIPKLATMDPNMYKKLYALKVNHEGAVPLLDLVRQNTKKGQAFVPGLPEILPDGFTVTIKTPANPAGRTIRVIPMPKELKSGLAKPKN